MGALTVAALLPPLMLAALGAQPLREPKNFSKNKHVAYQAAVTPKGGFHVRFQFKDHTEQLLVFEHTYDYQRTLDMAARFGLPSTFFQPYSDKEKPNRQKITDNALFRRNGSTVEADLSAVTTYYSEFAQPIASFILSSLRERGLDTRENRIAMAMTFVQDIPYGVPEFEDDGIFRSGISPAPLILLTGFGDCDSKATLFAGILRYLIDPADILFVSPEGVSHVLIAIRAEPTQAQRRLAYEGHTFVYADTAGPGRLDFGELDRKLDNIHSFTVEPFTLKTLPFHADADYGPKGRPVFRDPGGGRVGIGTAVARAQPPPPPHPQPESQEAGTGVARAGEQAKHGAPPREEGVLLSSREGWELRSDGTAQPLTLKYKGRVALRAPPVRGLLRSFMADPTREGKRSRSR